MPDLYLRAVTTVPLLARIHAWPAAVESCALAALTPTWSEKGRVDDVLAAPRAAHIQVKLASTPRHEETEARPLPKRTGPITY